MTFPVEPTLVLLHGFGTSSHVWRHVAEDLSGARALHPDLPGFGSCADQAGFGVAEMADAVQRDIERAHLQHFALIGHSMGGKVAALLASRRPPGLLGLALVASSPPTPEPMTDEGRETLRAAYGDTAALKTFYQGIIREPLDGRDMENLVQDGLRANRAAWNAWLDFGSREDISAQVGHIEVPILLLASREDPVMTPEVIEGQVLPHFPGAQYELLKGGGHLLPLEIPGEVTRHLLHWTRNTLKSALG